jgi:hypothetical protein
LKIKKIIIPYGTAESNNREPNESYYSLYFAKNSFVTIKDMNETNYQQVVTRWENLVKTDYINEINQTCKVDDVKAETFFTFISSLELLS